MLLNDQSHPPLLVTVGLGSTTAQDLESYTEAWNRLLDAGERFAALRVFVDEASTERPHGSAQKAKAWLERYAPAIREQVWGMATVVLTPAAYEQLRKMNVEKLFGVPAATHPHLGAALVWLQETVYTPRGLTLPVEPVASTVARLCWEADV